MLVCRIVLRSTAEISIGHPAMASRSNPIHNVSTRPNTAMAVPQATTAKITPHPWRLRLATQPVVSAPMRAPTPGAA